MSRARRSTLLSVDSTHVSIAIGSSAAAPAHARIDGDVDESLVSLAVTASGVSALRGSTH